MTISSSINKSGPYPGNGVTTAFDYDFKIASASHVLAILTDANNVETTLTLTTDYSVTGVGAPGGGQIILADPLPSGERLTLLLNVPFTQQIDLENQGTYYAETVEAGLDLAAQRDLQLQEQIDRAIKIPASGDVTELNDLVAAVVALNENFETISEVTGALGAINSVSENLDIVDVVADNIADVTNFAGVYYGPSAVDPTTRRDGTALQEGDLYFNTSSSLLRMYDGDEWRDASAMALNMVVDRFVGNGAQTNFTLSSEPALAANVLVWQEGVRQVPITDYTVSGTTLAFAVAPGNGDVIDTLIVATTASLAVPALGSVVANSISNQSADQTAIRNKIGAASTSNFQGDGGTGGAKGLVPAPAAGDAAANKFLSAGGAWVDPKASVFPFRIVAGVLRPNNLGVWSILNDGDHIPINMTGISQNSNSIFLDYPTASKVVSFIATTDETMALARIFVGSSVGFSQARIQLADASNSPLNPNTITNTGSNIWIYGIFLP